MDMETEQESMDGSPALVQTEYISLKFQCGVIPEVEENGCTIREVIDLLVTRLEGFQVGEFSCRENALAITKLQEAHHWLEHREKDRKAREVEGKYAR